jgi:histidinol phosphatase-like PHP family hydrolase
MKNWEKYSRFLDTGDFHVHADYADGSSSVMEMCEQAEMNSLKLICFAEHVRKNMFYEYSDLLRDVERARQRFPGLVILPGCEAAVCDPEGSLDVSDDVLKKAEIVVASFHDFPYGRTEDFLHALRSMLSHPRVDIWGHPETLLRNVTLEHSDMEGIIRACIKRKVLIEDNLNRMHMAPPEFLELARRLGAGVVTNSDAHHVSDLKTVQ